jgi:hypothetical protein
VKQYVGQGQQALVPRVIGQTQRATAQKAVGGGSRESRQWDEPSFLAELEHQRGSEALIVAERMLEWAASHNLRLWWGKGVAEGSLYPLLEHSGQSRYLFSIITLGRVYVQFGWLMTTPGFEEESERLELRRRLNEIPSIQIDEDRITRYPPIPVASLTQPGALDAFLSVFDWVIEEIRRH